MAVFKLESLVLRGSAVLSVGTAGNPRLGTGGAAKSKTPEIVISMRRPSHAWTRELPPVQRSHHTDYFRVDALTAYGAGRSSSRRGILCQSRWCKPVQRIAAASS